jgi:hypothetical protein
MGNEQSDRQSEAEAISSGDDIEQSRTTYVRRGPSSRRPKQTQQRKSEASAAEDVSRPAESTPPADKRLAKAILMDFRSPSLPRTPLSEVNVRIQKTGQQQTDQQPASKKHQVVTKSAISNRADLSGDSDTSCPSPYAVAAGATPMSRPHRSKNHKVL